VKSGHLHQDEDQVIDIANGVGLELQESHWVAKTQLENVSKPFIASFGDYLSSSKKREGELFASCKLLIFRA